MAPEPISAKQSSNPTLREQACTDTERAIPPSLSANQLPTLEAVELLEPGIGDIDNSAVELRQALQLVLGDGIVGVLECPEPDCLAIDVLTDRAIRLGPLRTIDGIPRLFEQR